MANSDLAVQPLAPVLLLGHSGLFRLILNVITPGAACTLHTSDLVEVFNVRAMSAYNHDVELIHLGIKLRSPFDRLKYAEGVPALARSLPLTLQYLHC